MFLQMLEKIVYKKAGSSSFYFQFFLCYFHHIHYQLKIECLSRVKTRDLRGSTQIHSLNSSESTSFPEFFFVLELFRKLL